VANFGDAPYRLECADSRVVLSSGAAPETDGAGVTVGPRTAVILARG
jgi:hypothetical protein